MNTMNRLFIDLDGPLLDGKRKHYYCYHRILEKYDFRPINIEEYWKKKREMIKPLDLLKYSGAEDIYHKYLTEWLELIESPYALSLDKVQDGAINCLDNWKSCGFEMILVTMRKNKHALELQLSSTGLENFFHTVLICDNATNGVGKAGAVRSMFYESLPMDHSWWIGDTEADWEAAHLLGWQILMVANGLRSAECLSKYRNCKIFPSISSIEIIP